MKRFNNKGIYNRRDFESFYYIVRCLKREKNKGYFIVFDRETMRVLLEDWIDIQEDDFFECEYIYPGNNNSFKVYAD